MKHYESWGRYPKAEHSVFSVGWRHQEVPFPRFSEGVLPFGLGRSYGDVCLNDQGTLLHTQDLRHLISFDSESGVLECEAGISLQEIIEIFLPKGWFPPVVPGTKFVTVGGAIANDIHGKNHHRAGTFGCHVQGFELLRSSGERIFCSPQKNTELFEATIGGLGLTGLILWARIQLKKMRTPWLDVEHLPFVNLHGFLSLCQDSDSKYEYTVAWLDCVSGNAKAGRGIFIRGNPSDSQKTSMPMGESQGSFKMPVDAPPFLLNRHTMGLMNEAYFRLQSRKKDTVLMGYEPFFFPLDKVHDWNRFYGRAGFLQYQFVLPEGAESVLQEIFDKIVRSGLGSFLAVLKRFGDKVSPGLLSFPMKGLTLALDFPIHGTAVFELLSSLDELVAQAGGAVYPAKDARMSAQNFRLFFPKWEAFSRTIDPKFSSDFWKRVAAQKVNAGGQ